MYYGEDEQYLCHYGMPRRSGRYPWGSGENPYQHSGNFLSRVNQYKAKGMSDSDIAKELGTTVTKYKSSLRIAKHQEKQRLYDSIKSMQGDGLGATDIARKLGLKNESSVRSIIDSFEKPNLNKKLATDNTADILQREIESKNIIDVGKGVAQSLGITEGTLKEACTLLQAKGYNYYGNIKIPNITNPGKVFETQVLAKSDVSYQDIYKNIGDIREAIPGEYHSADGGIKWYKREYPQSIDSKRISVRYGDDGGTLKDGVIEIRPGVKDLSLGNSHYSQVRILVDGTHYLKGMAIYSDDIPEGTDILFNTNKKKGTPLTDSDSNASQVLKPINTKDPGNPFGAYIKANGQSYYIGQDGKEHLSAINKLKDEGDYKEQSLTVASQFLGKQPRHLISRQLNATYNDAVEEYEKISSLTNPVLKKKMLKDFGDECDSKSVHLKAKAFPGQTSQVILPVSSLKENEVYAPNYENGTQLALVRYPHAGPFEIPVLTVNNRNKEGKKVIGNDIIDAIGINEKTAQRLSGADFDGDSVTCIPTNKNGIKIKSIKVFKDLEGFDPKISYPHVEGAKIMSDDAKGIQMGMISNLITDMTLKGANENELARAVKHSMVVIDAPKHKLDYIKSEQDNDISGLKKKYQLRLDDSGKKIQGASTLLSRTSSPQYIPRRVGQVNINQKGKPWYDPSKPEGAYIYKNVLDPQYKDKYTWVDSKGTLAYPHESVKLGSITQDANKLSSGTIVEQMYAKYSNDMKALGNKARIESASIKTTIYNPSAAKVYSDEVTQLKAALTLAKTNSPKERRAQSIAYSRVQNTIKSNPELKDDKKLLNQINQLAINEARTEVGTTSKDTKIKFTDKQWQAIQSGALSDSTVSEIFKYADQDDLVKRSLPKSSSKATLSDSKISRIKSLSRNGLTNKEIADILGVSLSTVTYYLRGDD